MNSQKIKETLDESFFEFEKAIKTEKQLDELTIQTGLMALKSVRDVEKLFKRLNIIVISMMYVDLKTKVGIEPIEAIIDTVKMELNFLQSLVAEFEFRNSDEEVN